MRDFRRRVWHARLTWKMTAVVTACACAALLLCLLIPWTFAQGLAVSIVVFVTLGVLGKMGENDTRHRLAGLPQGAALPWWQLRPSLDFPWWSSWLLVSAVLLATTITANATDGVWWLVAYMLGLLAVALVRRTVVRAKRRSRERRAV